MTRRAPRETDRTRRLLREVTTKSLRVSPVLPAGEALPPRYPDIRVQLMGFDRGEYGPLARCLAAMTSAGISHAEQDRFTQAATAGDYDDLLRVSADWLTVAD